MESSLQIFSQYLSSVIVNVIIFSFLLHSYKPKYKRKVIYISAFSIWTLVMFSINLLHNPPLNMTYAFISVQILVLLLFDTTFKSSWLCNILIVLLSLFSDTVTFFMWSAILGKSTAEIYVNAELMVISNLLNVLLFYIIYRVLLVVLSKSDFKEIQIKETIFLALMTVFENFIVYSFSLKIKSHTDGLIVIAILVGFLLLNLYTTYLLKNVADVYEYRYKNSILAKQSKLQLQNYIDLDEKYTQSRKIIHDMKKHLMVYNELLGTDKAEEYRAMLECEINKLFRGYQCSNSILSIITSQKYLQSEKQGIKVTVKMEDLELSFIDDLDITAIFANLWDNAIEACEDIEPNNRYIEFAMRKVNGFVIITMVNPCNDDKSNFEINDKVISTKQGHMGVGISIIKSAVKKYNGFIFFNFNSVNVFTVEITIPLN